jgi:hypothetical protein
MTLDQILLTGLVAATVASLVIAWLVHRTRAKWRQRDLLREFIGAWSGQVVIPTERDALFPKDESLRLPVEQEAHFPLAFKLAPKGLQHEYEEFIKARSTYIITCQNLYNQIKRECADKTGIPVTDWGDARNWPENVLLPNFVLSIYEKVLGIEKNAFGSLGISYDIGQFSETGQGFERKGLRLTIMYGDFDGPELAQASDEATLKKVSVVHRQMMEADYCGKFTPDVEHVGSLREEASAIASKVSEALRRLQFS